MKPSYLSDTVAGFRRDTVAAGCNFFSRRTIEELKGKIHSLKVSEDGKTAVVHHEYEYAGNKVHEVSGFHLVKGRMVRDLYKGSCEESARAFFAELRKDFVDTVENAATGLLPSLVA